MDFAADTVTKEVNLDNELKAAFETTNTLCPEDSANFKIKVSGILFLITGTFKMAIQVKVKILILRNTRFYWQNTIILFL